MRFASPVSRLKRLLPIFVLVLLSRPLFAADATVLDRIFAGKRPDEAASILVVLRGQADLSGSANIPDRAERKRSSLRSE